MITKIDFQSRIDTAGSREFAAKLCFDLAKQMCIEFLDDLRDNYGGHTLDHEERNSEELVELYLNSEQ